ncbi:MAG: hypothetical protein U0166_09225 [Acidobacteriota bacterium]
MTGATSAPAWKRFLSPDNRYLPPVFITLILVGGNLQFGILESWQRTALAIATSIGCEAALCRFVHGRWPNVASAYITGISVGILVRSPAYWPYVLCSAISILTKYTLRMNGRHIWNPSNFGVSAMLFLAPDTVAGLSIQWGNQIWAMLVIWVLGSIIITRAGRIHISATYVTSFLILSSARAAITGQPFLATIAPITGPMYQLFIFFMITDPKTTVSTRRGRCVVAFLIAVVEMVLRLLQIVYAPFYALFFVGSTAFILDQRRERRIATRRAVTASAG